MPLFLSNPSAVYFSTSLWTDNLLSKRSSCFIGIIRIFVKLPQSHVQCPLGELPRGLGGGTGTYPHPEASSGGFVGRFAQPLQLRKLKSTRIGCWANRPGMTPGSYWNPAGLSGQPCVADGQAAQPRPDRGLNPAGQTVQVAILACGRARLQGYATLEGTPSPSWRDASLGSRKLGDGLSGLPSRAAHPVGARVPPGRVPRQGSRAPRWCRC